MSRDPLWYYVLDWGYKRPVKAFIVVFALLFAFGITTTIISAKIEADTYNRVTGSDVTWWDAVWVEFRVVGGTNE